MYVISHRITLYRLLVAFFLHVALRPRRFAYYVTNDFIQPLSLFLSTSSSYSH